MAKFNQNQPMVTTVKAQTGPKGPLKTKGEETSTHEGGTGYNTGTKTELFRNAVSNMGNEQKFYTSAQEQDNRFVKLVHKVTSNDPEWVQKFVPFLREKMFMRSASIMLACEYVAAGGPNGAAVIDAACSRADEPAEVLGYWLAKYGRQGGRKLGLPAQLRKGLQRATSRLYTERNALKYDGTGNDIRFADVIELVRTKPKDDKQSALFKYLLDVRHRGTDAIVEVGALPTIKASRGLEALNVGERRALVEARTPDLFKDAEFTWERLSGWLQGPMDAAAWETMIPNMGVFALIRNLRNFDEAKISKESVEKVKQTISDPEVIKRSKMFPYRMWSAYKNAPGMHWGEALEAAVNTAASLVPELPGSLVLVDYSASMGQPMSQKSQVELWEVGALFGIVQYVRTKGNSDLVAFASQSKRIPISGASSVLKAMSIADSKFRANAGSGWGGRGDGGFSIGHGTNLTEAVREHFDPKKHQRIVIFSDMQCMNRGDSLSDIAVPIYSYDLGGYQTVKVETGSNRHLLAGFSDASFRMMEMLEAGDSVDWDTLFSS